MRRIELLDDAVVVIEVYGRGRHERSALLKRLQRMPLRVRRKRGEDGGGNEQGQRSRTREAMSGLSISGNLPYPRAAHSRKVKGV